MSIIGIIALAGIMIKNIIVLMNEINYQTLELNIEPREAVLESTISRIRTVGLAALTTIFGMLPLVRDLLYGDMATTVLTLYIFPVIYITAKK